MPEKLDSCVRDVLKRWKENPGKRPKGAKTDKDLRSSAFAICQKSIGSCYQTSEDDVDIFLEASGDGGHGPLLAGVAALNDPHLSHLRQLEVVVRDGKEFIKAHILRFGVFRHPKAPDGKLIINQTLYDKLASNFKNNVFGRKLILDDAHMPNRDSYGDVTELEQQGGDLFAWVDPTPVGLNAVKNRLKNYASSWIYMKWRGNEVKMSSADFVEEDIMEMALEEAERYTEATIMGDKDKVTPVTKETPDMVQLSQADHDAMLAAVKTVGELEKKYELELKTISDGAAERETKLQQQIDTIELRSREQTEQLRLERIDMLAESWTRPDEMGGMLPKQVADLARVALRGDSLGEGDGAITLSADSSTDQVHGYYRQVVERLVKAVPRVVPAGQLIMPFDRRSATNGKSSEELKMARRDELIETSMDIHNMTLEEAEKRADKVLKRDRIGWEV